MTSAPQTAPDFSQAVKQSLDEGRTAKDTAQAARADLDTVDAILNEIDAKMGSGGSISDDELALIQSALKDLGSRSGRYSSPSGN